MSGFRCLVADDHPALLDVVCDQLRAAGFEPLEPVTAAHAAIDLAAREHPELALVDYRMPGLPGPELVRRLTEVSPETRVAVYTADADEHVAREALAAGAAAIVLKDAPLADLARALHAVVAGRTYVDPAVAVTLGGAPERGELTERERAVLVELAAGKTHDEIGRKLGISSETVRTHARKAASRLGARTRTQAVAEALRRRLIS